MKKIIIIIYIIISLSYLSSNNCVHHSNLKNVYIKNSSALIISNEDLIKTIHPETIFTRLDVNSNNKFVHLEKQSFQFKDPKKHLLLKPIERYENCDKEKLFHKLSKFKQYDRSACPEELWFEDLRNVEDGRTTKVFVNVGFNKGYNFAQWMNLFSPLSFMTPRKWFQILDEDMAYSLNWRVSCGNCNDCFTTYTENYEVHNEIIVLGIDMNINNIELVTKVADTIKSSNYARNSSFYHTQLYLVNSAVSNGTGEMTIPRCEGSDEACSIDENERSEHGLTKNTNTNITVPISSIDIIFDDFLKYIDVQNQVTKLKNNNDLIYDKKDISIIDMLIIDTEGHDPLVLQGAYNLLKSSRVRSLIFEYHGIGIWRSTPLKEVIDSLDEFNYQCFLAGTGKLWTITGCFYHDWEFHRWSNVMCFNRNDIWMNVIQKYIIYM